ncbi:MAG: hypothetical protein NZ808_08540 [Myxococcota bacterium]|nr:hypothetical protein [Myxococcota bacterium]
MERRIVRKVSPAFPRTSARFDHRTVSGGKGMVLLESIVDVVYEPWIDHVLLKILGPNGHAFLQNPNTVLTPHIGGTAYDT